MKKFFQKSLLLILLLFGGIHSAFADYWSADSYNGHFNFGSRTTLTLDNPWVSWNYPYRDEAGIDDVMKYSRFYVGGSAASLTTYNTNPSSYFSNPWEQGKEILYMDREINVVQHSNADYGVSYRKNLFNSGDLKLAEFMFYPGEKMGPAQMCGFFVRWTGWWDIDDDNDHSDSEDGYWMGMARSKFGGSSLGADWNREEGKGIVRYGKMTYDLPATKTATFTRKPGGKIAVSVTGNIHDSWNEYYGFGSDKSVNEYGYYNNSYGTVQLNNTTGAASKTLDGTFDETQNYTIYYHEFYKRKQNTTTQHFQGSILSTTVKGFMYPSDLQVSQDKWEKKITLSWKINNNSTKYDTDGGWLVFRRKKGETGYELLTNTKLNKANNTYTDDNIDTGAEYTYWVTFAPNIYDEVSEPIASALTVSRSVKHDNYFTFSNMNVGLNDGANGGIKISWKPEKDGGSDVTFFIQRWNESIDDWQNLKDVGQTTTTYIDNDVTSWKEYKYRIKTSYWGLDFYSEEKTITYAVMTKVDEFTASQGTYSNMVKLNWRVTVLSEGDTRFVVYRKLLGDPQAVFTQIYETVGKESAFYYEDMSAQSGQFYDYKVTAFAYVPATNTTSSRWAEGNSMESDGFVQSRGILSGRIKYGTGVAVPNAKVTLIKGSDNDDTAKQFYSLHLDGNNTSGMQWNPSDEMIKNYFTGSNHPWTIQMYVRPESNMTGTQSIFDVNGYAGLGVSPATGGYELQVKSATGSNAASYGATGIVIPANEYSHLVFSYDGGSTYTLRAIRLADESENGISFEEGKTLKTFTGKANVKFEDANRSRSVTFGKSGFKGYIDEMRVWTKVLTDDEVNTYHNRTLSCTEKNLLAYWPVDEGINGLHNIYDYSKTNGVANSNHATVQGVVLNSEVVPTEEQLSIFNFTDENGNYVIRGIPFSGDGTTYLVRPTLGIHQFNPTYHTRYVSSNTLTHDNIEFEDVSSFPVTGVVYYENTTYPVQGCNIYVDGNICSKDGKLIETDEQGRFEISVPIGDHHITVGKNGHTFTDEGRYPTGVDTKFTFDRSVSNLTFYDNTLVNLAGRIVGGNIEGDKPVGFAESVNNIGVAQIVLTPTNDNYLLNAVKVVNGTTYSYESNTENLNCASGGYLVGSSSWRGSGENAGKIFIQTDATTGEFSAMVPPITYNVSEAVVVKTSQSVGEAGFVDLSNATHTTSDTLVVAGEESVFEYHTLYKRTYHSEPNFTVTQDDFENGAFGIAQRTFKDEVGEFTINFVNKENTPVYEHDYPFFVENDNYVFTIKGYEQYTNYDGDTEETTTVPLKNCIVTIANGLANNQRIAVEVAENNEDGLKVGDVIDVRTNQIALNEKGEAKYRWQAGNANITAPYTRTLSMTYEIDGKENTWYFNGDQAYMEAIILGTLPTGTNFVTQGPDQVLMILRDPPGSGSSAEWSKGTVTVNEVMTGELLTEEKSARVTASLGGDVTLITGVGVAYEQQTSTSDDTSLENVSSTEIESSTTKAHTLSISEAISTSDDPSLVGSLGDVFIGQSTNLLFGKAREVSFHRENGEINLGVKDVFTVGSKFSTQFNYTGYYIQNYLLPNLESMRNNLLISVTPEEYDNFTNTTDCMLFVTKLSPDDPNFGKNNSDEVWGNLAVKNDVLEGPSYKIVLPQRMLSEKVYDKWETVSAEYDSIYFYNLQINNWKNQLAANEKEKVEAWENRSERLLKNYSFDGGASVTYSYETDSTTTFSYTSNIGNTMMLGNVFGFDFCGIGWEIESSLQKGSVTLEGSNNSTSDISSFTFNLVESGDDALTVDVYKSPYSYIFRTRGGQTSAPYEDVEYTQYFEPGKHKLHEATMQIEVPDIEVEVASVTNLPSGSAANYTLLLSNKSEIDCDLYYKLLQMDETNPDGAQLSIDGVALSDNRVIKVPAGEVVKKTLLLKQSNLGVLDYENIGIVLSSIEQGDPTGTYPQIADTVYISAHYVPSSSPVKMELNRTLLNTTSGANLDITFNSFDRNYYNLKAFRVQYQKQGDTDWTLLKEYLVKVEEGQQLSASQAVLPDAADVTYSLDMSSFADGKYTFRVLSASTYGTGEATLVTDAVEVVKDMARPMAFGTPKPTTGFLGMGDNIELTFNEDINSGRLTSAGNFLVTAALNGAPVAHNVALMANGGEDAVAKTDADINLIGKSFAVDLWTKINGEGTIFSHGNGQNKLTLGVKEVDSKYYLCVNGEVCSTKDALPTDKWIYLAFSLDQEHADESYFSALYANDDGSTVYLAEEKPIEKYEGNGRVAVGVAFDGAIHEVALWDEAINVANLQLEMHETKKPTAEHLIGYWKLNEGAGTQAKDLARNRHMTLGNTSWYLNNKNKALNLVDEHFEADDAMAINLGACAAGENDDYAVEMWFHSPQEQSEIAYLFDTDVMSLVLENGKMKLYAKDAINNSVMSMGNKTYNDGKWHHVAVNVLRNANTTVYIDGESVGQIASTKIPAFKTEYMYLGAQCHRADDLSVEVFQNKFKGEIDEVRVWNATMNASVIRDRMNMRLTGEEPGLAAYYPFEMETLDANTQIVTVANPMDMVGKLHEVEMRRTENFEIVCVDEAPGLRPAANATNVNYNFVASERGIVIELNEDADRLEGVTVNVTVKDVLDLNGNKSLPITWTALVKRNQLLWFDNNIDVVGKMGEEKKFTATITNQSAQTEYWALNDLPSWLSANFTSGSLPALGNQEITFTVDASAPTGKSEYTVYMSGNNAIPVPLTVNINLKAQAPEWSVNPEDFEGNATLFGVVKMNVDGKVIYSEDEDDLLAAFVDGQCVGLTNVQYEDFSDSYRAYLSIYGNSEMNGKPIELKAWDASTGIVHPVVKTFGDSESQVDGVSEVLTYADNMTWGDYDNTYLVYATNYIQQSTPLKKNWNWISVYVNNLETNNEINEVLQSLKPNGIAIKNVNKISEYTAGFGWMGDAETISNSTMYKLQLAKTDTLVANGEPTDVAGFTAKKGWNWVPYTRSFSLSIDDAFASAAPSRNDQIKGQEGYAMYNGTSWNGTLKALTPGKGYLYKSNAEGDIIVQYPAKRNEATLAFAPARRLNAIQKHFTPIDPTEFESNMTLLAVVMAGDKVVENATEIGVFNGSTCLASATVEEDGYFYLTVPGDKTLINRLTVYAVVNGEVTKTTTTLHFDEDATLGDYDAPLVMAIGEFTAIDQILASGKYDRLQVTDLGGRVVYSGIPSEFKSTSLNDGVFIFTFVTRDGQTVSYKQLINKSAHD